MPDVFTVFLNKDDDDDDDDDELLGGKERVGGGGGGGGGGVCGGGGGGGGWNTEKLREIPICFRRITFITPRKPIPEHVT